MTITLDATRDALRKVGSHPALGKNAALEILANVSLGRACTIMDLYAHERPMVYKACLRKLAKAEAAVVTMPPMKISMMLHFAVRRGPFTPEAQRTSPAYTTFVKELLRDGMIERPTKEQREEWDGWAYKATLKGQCYVKALTEVPMPVRTDPVWTMPR